jgi:hypothetical protein
MDFLSQVRFHLRRDAPSGSKSELENLREQILSTNQLSSQDQLALALIEISIGEVEKGRARLTTLSHDSEKHVSSLARIYLSHIDATITAGLSEGLLRTNLESIIPEIFQLIGTMSEILTKLPAVDVAVPLAEVYELLGVMSSRLGLDTNLDEIMPEQTTLAVLFNALRTIEVSNCGPSGVIAQLYLRSGCELEPESAQKKRIVKLWKKIARTVKT